VAVTNKSFHKALPLIGRLRSKHRVIGSFATRTIDTLAFRFAFAQPDAGERGIE